MAHSVDDLNAALAGRYRVKRQLGEGGMATVYLAEDLRHGRKVALKVLEPSVAAIVGGARFLAEIKTTASLQHPHILPLFDSGEADGVLYYVMPVVEGESLKDRLDREGQLPVADAVEIATQVADALDYAHQRGVVHRDIKPANILLHGKDAFVADFGIALAVGAGSGRLTQTGVSVGSPPYMSPEQATGDSSVGAATDVWSLGCVLYEMLAGTRPYDGSTPQAILGRIVSGSHEPVTKQRRTTPAHVAAAVARALEPVPADRFETAGDFALALRNPRFRHGETGAARRSMGRVAVAAAGFYALGLLTWWLMSPSTERSEDSRSVSFVIPGISGSGLGRTVAISPDGTLLADAAPVRNLSVRRIGDLDPPRDLRTVALQPFFSPDGTHIGYFEGIAQSLMRTPTAGGTPVLVAEGDGARSFGANWGDDGTIVFATSGGLYRVPADGGTAPERLLEVSPGRGGVSYSWPQWLPGGRRVLLTVVPVGATTDSDCSVVVLDLDSGELTEVLSGGSSGRYLPSGHLLYSADGGTLHAVEFDASSGQVRGDRVALPITGLPLGRGWGADFDVSADGTLVYLLANQRPGSLVWIDRAGQEEPLSAPPRGYNYPRVSPDGARVAVDIGATGARDIGVWDIERGALVLVASDPAEEWGVEWSPRGDSVYYASNQAGGTFLIYRRAADGSGEPVLVFPHTSFQVPQDITADGSRMVVIESRPSPTDQFDLMALVLSNPVQRETVLSTPGGELNASLSPDGRYVAYQTYEGGQSEVYASPMDDARRERVKVSLDGGEKPIWSPTGDEIFYRSPTDSLMAASVVTEPRMQVRDVNALFRMGYGAFGNVSGRAWDVSPVDGRFLLVKHPPRQGVAGVHVVLNWTPELLRAMEP